MLFYQEINHYLVNRQRLKGYLDALKDHHLEAKEELQIFVDANQANYEGARQIINQLIKKELLLMGYSLQMTGEHMEH